MDRVCLSDSIRLQSFSPSQAAPRQGRFASASCRSTIGPGAGVPHCSFGPSDRDLDLLAERHAVELVEDGLMEPLSDAIGLRALGLGARVVDVLDRQIELI